MSEFFSAAGAFLRDMFVYSMIAIFLENTIFSRGIGTSPALFATRKKYSVLLLGIIMTVIVSVSAVIVYFIFPYLKQLSFSYYVIPPVYVAVIGLTYVGALLFTHRFVKKRKEEVLSIIHIGAFNCAVLGALMLATNNASGSFGAFLGFAAGTAIGFTLAAYFIGIAYERLSSEAVPKPFRGFPITLIYIGLVSLAMYGLIGHELPF